MVLACCLDVHVQLVVDLIPVAHERFWELDSTLLQDSANNSTLDLNFLKQNICAVLDVYYVKTKVYCVRELLDDVLDDGETDEVCTKVSEGEAAIIDLYALELRLWALGQTGIRAWLRIFTFTFFFTVAFTFFLVTSGVLGCSCFGSCILFFLLLYEIVVPVRVLDQVIVFLIVDVLRHFC